ERGRQSKPRLARVPPIAYIAVTFKESRNGAALESRELAIEDDRAGPDLPRPGGARSGREAARHLPAARVRGRGAGAEGEARPRGRGRGVSRPGARSRRE